MWVIFRVSLYTVKNKGYSEGVVANRSVQSCNLQRSTIQLFIGYVTRKFKRLRVILASYASLFSASSSWRPPRNYTVTASLSRTGQQLNVLYRKHVPAWPCMFLCCIQIFFRLSLQHPVGKFLGECNDIKRALNRCLKEEVFKPFFI